MASGKGNGSRGRSPTGRQVKARSACGGGNGVVCIRQRQWVCARVCGNGRPQTNNVNGITATQQVVQTGRGQCVVRGSVVRPGVRKPPGGGG